MKQHRKILLALLSIAMVCSLFVVGISAESGWLPENVDEQYDLGSVFIVPTRSIHVDGQTVQASAVVHLPDGTVTSRDVITLSEVGRYTVVYTATVNGKVYTDEVSFQVVQEFCTLTSGESTAVYEKYPHLQAVSGLRVSLKYGDKLTLNEPIDMSALENNLLIQSFVIPENPGAFDFEKLCFQFTDSQDPSITLYMSVRQYTNNAAIKASYVTAGGNGQEVIGYDDFAGKFWAEGLWGRSINHGFGFMCNDAYNSGINLSFDSSTMQVLANDNFVVDLDDVEYQSAPWSGFPSGKAYLTVWAENYRGTTATFFLSKVGNVDLSLKKIQDKTAPQFQVDTPYETMPNAVAGGSYAVPSATAKDDFSGSRDVTVTAWYNLSSADASILNIVDGRFETPWVGDYAIVYEATDKSGNLGREILWIKAVQSITAPAITLKEEPKTDYVLGEHFQSTAYTTKCHSGDPVVRAYTVIDGKEVSLTADTVFETTGTYKVVYEVMDCAGQKSTSEFDITVKTGDKPILVDTVTLPQYMIEGTQYTFPTVYFNDYRGTEMVRKPATGKVVDASGTNTVEAGGKYELLVEKNMDPVKIIFECEGAVYETEIPVVKLFDTVDGKTRACLENYFVGSGFTCTRDAQSLIFTATKANGGWTFANKLLATDFYMELKGVARKTGFDALVLTMQDAQNKDSVLEVELINRDGRVYVKVGEKMTGIGEVSFVNENSISVAYKDNILYVAGFKIDTGSFEGFASNYLNLSIRFRNARNGAYQVLFLNNHATNNSNRDRVEAQIDILGEYGGRHIMGTEITLPAAMAADVLNPNVPFTVTVKQGDNVVTAIDGTALENADPTKAYTIKLDVADRYTVIYNAEDSFSEKTASLSYILHVVDATAPEISFAQSLPTEAKLGDTLVIPDFTVTDNTTPTEQIVVLKNVVTPNGMMVTIPADSNAIRTSQVGVYKFTILAMDAEGHMCNKTWTVNVRNDAK